ncbi:NUDIX hydrolase [Citrobacter arsenatis]|uniref:NUDIX hydrolase n=1 Tax=Citrobacter arsenatis TaxID=2546350 RepID=UPI00300DEF68
MSLTELEIAQRIRDGTIPSPVKFSNMWLVCLRITGTGLAYRSGLKEHVWRDPNLYLNEAFLERCNGLAVLLDHPDELKMTEEDFKTRCVGTVMLPFIRDDEVWAICRIYIRDVVDSITKGTVSTSPGVVFDGASGNQEVQEGDTNFLIEGVPFLVDHIALVTEKHGTLGVWDKDGIPEGIDLTNKGDLDMDEKLLQTLIAQAVGQAMSGVSDQLSNVVTRMDSLEKGYQARADADETAAKEEKAKADAEEKAKADAAEEEQRKADEAEAQKNAEEKAKADAAEEEEKKKAEEEKAKADAEENARNDSALTAAQVRADSAYTAIGKKAPAPFSGEKAMDYRKRVLEAMQQHSERFKDADIRAIADSVVLAGIEDIIYADARKAVETEMSNTKGVLYERIRNDAAGRRIVEFRGDPNSWMSAFKTPPKFAHKFNTGVAR